MIEAALKRCAAEGTPWLEKFRGTKQMNLDRWGRDVLAPLIAIVARFPRQVNDRDVNPLSLFVFVWQCSLCFCSSFRQSVSSHLIFSFSN